MCVYTHIFLYIVSVVAILRNWVCDNWVSQFSLSYATGSATTGSTTIPNNLVNPNGGLAKGVLARKVPIGGKKPWGPFVAISALLPWLWGCGGIGPANQPRKGLGNAPISPDFPGPIPSRFSLKIWSLSPCL